mgnify:CR=1 FL=1
MFDFNVFHFGTLYNQPLNALSLDTLMRMTESSDSLTRSSSSASHSVRHASDGIRQSPRGDSVTEPTFTPSGRHERLNCCEKKREINDDGSYK